MSFADMDKPQLLEVAETFGVEVDGRWGEERIRAEILNDGVTWETWEEANAAVVPELLEEVAPEPEEEPEPEPVVDTTKKFRKKNVDQLLKMERRNPSFSILGYHFTKNDPFVLMKPEDALWIMAHEAGFRVATPEEAEEFYNNGNR